MLVYVAGPYRAASEQGVDENIAHARRVATKLWEAGHAVICPHLNTAHFELDCNVEDVAYLMGDLKILARCDAIVMLSGWEKSKGASDECTYAVDIGMPVYDEDALPPLHPTELRCPTQVLRFAEILGRMHRTHLAKNADYSPLNIRGTGEIGVSVRCWDKVCRILNLLGFRIEGEFKGFEPPRAAQCEPLEDAWIDLANYGVIGLMNREGSWGL